MDLLQRLKSETAPPHRRIEAALEIAGRARLREAERAAPAASAEGTSDLLHGGVSEACA